MWPACRQRRTLTRSPGENRVAAAVPERAHLGDRGAVARGLPGIEALRDGLTGEQPLDPRIDLAGRDRALAQEPLLGAPQPALVVRGVQVVLGLHLLADRAPAALAEALDADDRRHRERPHLPLLLVRLVTAGHDDGAEAVHPAHVVDPVDAGHDNAIPFAMEEAG